MKKIKILFRLACLSLVLCMLLGVFPVYANEATEAPAEESKSETVQIVVAIKDIPQGTRLNDTHVKLVTVPNLNLPTNVLTDVNSVYTQYAATDLYEGEYVGKEQISTKRVLKANNDLLLQQIGESDSSYLVVTDYVKADTGEDIVAHLQALIDANPNRTLYFPDGEYIISTPLFTPSAPNKSVSFRLADGAVIKASDKWTSKDGCNYLLSIGGSGNQVNDIITAGSYYAVQGGTFDGNGEADGIIYAAGRESRFYDICIKNVNTGISIAYGVNNGSSDVDFEDIVIYGNGKQASRGFYVKGHDNTLTNIRVYNMETGIYVAGGTSLFKSLYVYNDPAKMEKYEDTMGIYSGSWGWFTDCTVENAAKAFVLMDNQKGRCIVSDCTVRWTSELCSTQTVITMGNKLFDVSGIVADFLAVEGATTAFLAVGEEAPAGEKILETCTFDESLVTVDTHTDYMISPVIPPVKKD